MERAYIFQMVLCNFATFIDVHIVAYLINALPGNIFVNTIRGRNSTESWRRSGEVTEQQWVGVM
jgi:hypothetical protein